MALHRNRFSLVPGIGNENSSLALCSPGELSATLDFLILFPSVGPGHMVWREKNTGKKCNFAESTVLPTILPPATFLAYPLFVLSTRGADICSFSSYT